MVDPATKQKVAQNLPKMEELAKSMGIKPLGLWTDIPSHRIIGVFDAPNAHSLSKLTIDAGLMEWNTVTISPIVTVQEAMSQIK